MPIREYECKECGETVEILHLPGGHDGPPDQCPHCGFWNSLSLKVSAFGFQLLGGGWPGKDG